MNFKPELCDKVLRGAKTVTRRPTNGKPCQYKADKDYAVCPGRGQRQLGRILVTSVREEQVGWIDDKDAVLEGFPNREAFVGYWRTLYGGMWCPDTAVWRIEFKLISVAPPREISLMDWDYKDQPDLEELARIVREQSGGTVHITTVPYAGGQEYAIAVCDRALSGDEALEAYRAWERKQLEESFNV